MLGKISGRTQTGILIYRRNTGKTYSTNKDRLNSAADYVLLQIENTSEYDEH